jgi:MFS family permease
MTNDVLALEYEPQRERERTRVYYGWVVLVVAALSMVSTFPGRSLGRGLITEGLLADLRLGKIAFGEITLWATLIGSTFSLACGPLIDRIGARVILTLNALLLGTAVLAMSRVQSPTSLAITLTLTLGLGQSALSVVSMSIVGKWFIRRIDTAMAVYAAIVSICFMAAFGGIEIAVKHAGWRSAWAGIGWTLLIGLAPLAWLLVRRTPESVGLHVDGGRLNAPRKQEPRTGATLRQALAAPAFWAFALSAAMFNLIFTGVTIFAEAIVRERGFYDAHTFLAASMTLAFGGLLANFVGGWLARKCPHGKLMAIGMLIVTAALLVLPFGHSTSALMTYALLMGIAGGVITVVFFACWTKAFGRAHLGKIQGTAQVMTVLSSALGPYILALGEKHRGSIAATFLILAPLVAAMAVACWFVPVPDAARAWGE